MPRITLRMRTRVPVCSSRVAPGNRCLIVGAVLCVSISATAPAAAEVATAQDPLTFTRVDSAGIEIVTSHAPAWGDVARWRVVREPAFDLGGADATGERNLDTGTGGIPNVTVLPDGTVVAGVAHEIRLFSPDGEFIRSFGRRGEGPGEFMAVPRIEHEADTIIAFDVRMARETRWSPRGELWRTTRATTRAVGQRPVGRTAAGPVFVQLVRGSLQSESLGGEPRAVRLGEVVAVSRELATADTLLTYWNLEQIPQDPEEVVENPSGGLTMSSVIRNIPVQRRGSVVAGRDRIVVGFGDRVDLSVVSPEGEPIRRIRTTVLDRTAEPVEDSIRAYYDEHRTDPTDNRFDWWDDDFVPEMWPPFDELFLDPEGNIWLRPKHLLERGVDPAPDQVWRVFDPTGVLLGSVAIPGRLRVLAITGDSVIGWYGDEWDSMHLVRHALEKREGDMR